VRGRQHVHDEAFRRAMPQPRAAAVSACSPAQEYDLRARVPERARGTVVAVPRTEQSAHGAAARGDIGVREGCGSATKAPSGGVLSCHGSGIREMGRVVFRQKHAEISLAREQAPQRVADVLSRVDAELLARSDDGESVSAKQPGLSVQHARSEMASAEAMTALARAPSSRNWRPRRPIPAGSRKD
jgi:hypothetical protein